MSNVIWGPKVFHSPQSLLHDPPHEILSGVVQDYFESPSRYHIILQALTQAENPGQSNESKFESSVVFSIEELDFLGPKKNYQVSEAINEQNYIIALQDVHSQEYILFLREIYEQWIGEGGSNTAVLPETFFRQDMLLQTPSLSTTGIQDGAIARVGRYSFDLSAPITEHTYAAAVYSAFVAIRGAQYLLDEHKSSFALCRPPGHHAAPSLCGGYCYLNNAAIAARYLQKYKNVSSTRELRKVAILDIDYHHGNGTSKAFYEDPTVYYVSLHGSPDYPYYTGAKEEKGTGEGIGTNLNFPLPLGTNDYDYLDTLRTACQVIKAWNPTFLIVSLGVDTFQNDPITDFKITLAAYPIMGSIIAGIERPTLFVMEGGYCLEAIGLCVRGVLEGFALHTHPDNTERE